MSAVRLRGHHLICLHFFGGEGYSDNFVENLHKVVQNAESGNVEIVAGPDDVCIACPSLEGLECSSEDQQDEEIRMMDRFALDLLGGEPGTSVMWLELDAMLEKIFPEWFSNFCIRCKWIGACERHPRFRGLGGKRAGGR